MYKKYKYSYLKIYKIKSKRIRSKRSSYLFLKRLSFNNINISKKHERNSLSKMRMSNTVYLEYLMNCLKNDNFKYEEINAFKLEQKEIWDNMNLGIREKNVFLNNVYNYNLKKKRKRGSKKRNIIKAKFKWNNSIITIYNNIKFRKMRNRLLIPHYFFSYRYTEKSKLAQSMSWKNNVYNFLKLDKSSIKYMDMYTEKIIRLFFNVGSINKGFRLTNIIKKGLTFRYSFPLFEYINRIIKYTSIRSSSSISQLTEYPKFVLTFEWLIEQIKSSIWLRKQIEFKKENGSAGFSTRKSKRVFNWDKILISKPIFKHTSFNVIIDLFVFNNKSKSSLDKKMDNILLRRIMYKYMYSMYYDWLNKVKETINRPRFFYLNLIQPNISYYYSEILKLYGKSIVKSNKTWFYFLCKIFFKWNFLNKNSVLFVESYYYLFDNLKNKYDSLFNFNKNSNIHVINKDIKNSFYKKRLYSKNLDIYKYLNSFIFFQKYIGFKKKNIKYFNILNKKNYLFNTQTINNDMEMLKLKKKKVFDKKKSKYLNQKKYLEEMEWRGNTPVDISKLTLWSRKGLGPKIIKTKEKKIFRHNKFSLEEFKRKIYYAKGKSKRKVSPKIWKTKLMSFFLFSHTKKKDANPNKKFLNLFNKKIDNYSKDSNNKFNSFNTNKNTGKSLINKQSFNFNNNNVNNNVINKNIKSKKEFIISKKESYANKYNKEFISDNKYNKESIYNKKELKTKTNNIISNLISPDNKLKIEKNKKTDIKIKYSSLNKSNSINPWDNLKNRNDKIDKWGRFNAVSLNKFYLNTIKWNIYNEKIKEKNRILFALNNKKVNKFNRDNRKAYIKMVNRKWNKNIYNKNFFQSIKNNFIYNKIISKKRGDNLDNYFIYIFSELYSKKNIENIFNWLKNLPYPHLIKKINAKLNNIDVFYLESIKNEFYNVKRDIIKETRKSVWPNEAYENNILNKSSYYNNNRDINISFKEGKENFNSKIWTNNVNNKRDESLSFKLGFNEEIIKPYYRHMIPLYIMESYFKFINYLGYTKLSVYFKWIWSSNLNWLKMNNMTILNYIIIKTLFDILRFNYRSLVRLKPKYYYINKLRYYEMKLNLLSFNNWTHSLKFIKNLRKTPNNFWVRYHKVASYYYGRIFQYAELDTQRKVLLPFVFYFEDILYNIYGKWALIRLWPLKRHFLNSYILAERLMVLLLARKDNSYTIKQFRIINRYFMYLIRTKQINKTYYAYNYANSRWPHKLINYVKDNNNKSFGILNYQDLERIEFKTKKEYILNTYFLDKKFLIHSLPFDYNYKKLCLKLHLKMFEFYQRKMLNLYSLNLKNYLSFWIRPLKNYIKDMNKGIDLKGIRFRLSGRSGMIKSVSRGLYKNYYYGNFLGPRHFIKKKGFYVSLYHTVLRGSIKSNIDYTNIIGVTANGCISLKVWVSSGLINDIQILLLHLLHIKNLYNQLLDKHILVNPFLKKIKNKNFKAKELYKRNWLKKTKHYKKKRIWAKNRIMQKLYNLYILYKCKKKIKRKKQYKQNKNIKKKYNRNSINKIKKIKKKIIFN